MTVCSLCFCIYVVPTTIITHFNNNCKELKVHRQETEILKYRTYSEVILTALLDSSPFWYMRRLTGQKWTFQKTQGLLVITRFWSLSHIFIYFQSLWIKYLQDMNIYNFCKGWDRKPGGEKETLLKKFAQSSLTD